MSNSKTVQTLAIRRSSQLDWSMNRELNEQWQASQTFKMGTPCK